MLNLIALTYKLSLVLRVLFRKEKGKEEKYGWGQGLFDPLNDVSAFHASLLPSASISSEFPRTLQLIVVSVYGCNSNQGRR